MKILILGTEARYRAYQPDMPFIGRQELVFLDKDSTEDTILAAGGDAEVLFVDAITPVSGALMERMPRLRLVHSEGVAFDRIDLAAARDGGGTLGALRLQGRPGGLRRHRPGRGGAAGPLRL